MKEEEEYCQLLRYLRRHDGLGMYNTRKEQLLIGDIMYLRGGTEIIILLSSTVTCMKTDIYSLK